MKAGKTIPKGLLADGIRIELKQKHENTFFIKVYLQ